MIKAKNFDKLEKKLEKISKIDVTLLNTIGQKVVTEIKFAFEDERSPFGERWKPLSPATLKRKKGSKILRESGNLATLWRVKVDGNKVKIYNNAEARGFKYGRTHQFGSKRVPARPFLPVKDGQMDANLKKILQKLIKSLTN